MRPLYVPNTCANFEPDQNVQFYVRSHLNAGGMQQEVSETVVTAKDAKEMMFDKWTKNERSASAHKDLMEVARPLRKHEAKKLPALQLLRAYPALGVNDILLAEFLADANISFEDGRERWRSVVEPLLQHYKEKKIPYIDGSLEERTLSILENIHRASTLWFKEKNIEDRKARVLELFPDNTPIGEIQTSARDAPRLIGIGSYSERSLSLSCYADSEPWFQESDPVKALFLLLAVYFVADIKWAPLTQLPLVFLTSATVGIELVKANLIRNQKLVDILKKMKAYS